MDQSSSASPDASADNGTETRRPEPVQFSNALDSQDDPEEIHLMEYVRILHKRRSPAVTVFAVCVISAMVYSFTATPVYEAQTQLLIESDKPNVV